MDSAIKQIEHLYKFCKNLDARLSRIEKQLNIQSTDQDFVEDTGTEFSPKLPQFSDSLEFQIGQYWLAKFGIVVISLGIVFLLTFPYKDAPPIFPSLLGYGLVGVIFILSYYWKTSYNFLSRYLLGSGLILLYFSTLRLHFFSTKVALHNFNIELFLLIISVAIAFVVAVKRKSVYLAAMSLTLGYITCIVSDLPYLLFILNTSLAILVVYLKNKYDWHNLIIYGIILTYFVHFTWFLNNPLLGRTIQLVNEPELNLLFLLLYGLIFATGNLFRNNEIPENNLVIVSTFLNVSGFLGLFLLITISKFNQNISLFHMMTSVLFLGLSVVFWIKEQSKYSTFFYAMLGYVALSVAIIFYFPKPDFFIWLCWQSLLVLSTAIWFRSKFIVVANFFIYLLIFLAYLVFTTEVSAVSISYGIVALLSARSLNWKKHRLELKTELMRNAYLATAFFIIPYALYHTIANQYVVIAWTAVALFYYLISLLLHNKKYRWMAIFTLLLTVLYVFIIGIIKLDPTYRIVSFIVLGIVLLVLSVIYSKIKVKEGKDQTN